MNGVLNNLHAPFVVIGDFNQIRASSKRWVLSNSLLRGTTDFNDFIFSHKLIDLPPKGVYFTWCNNHSGNEVIYERLDRCLVSSDWFDAFLSVVLTVLPIQRSDHSPILLDNIFQRAPVQ